MRKIRYPFWSRRGQTVDKRVCLLPRSHHFLFAWGLLLFLCLAPLLLAPLALAQTGVDEGDQSKDESTEINVKNADIAAIIRIFSKKTKQNYILDERVRGKVSIFLPGKVSAEESNKILDSVLALKGFSAVPIGENLYKIVPAKEAIQSTIPTVTDELSPEETSATMVTRLVQLKFVNADDAKQLLAPLVSSNGLLNAYTGTNSLIIIDSADNIARIVNIVEAVDLPSKDRELTIIPIEHADANDVAEKLKDILSDQDEPAAGEGSSSALDSIRARLRQTASRIRTAEGGAADTESVNATTVAAQGREPKIISDERTNSIIVVADEDTTARIRALIAQLDSEIDRSGFRFYVYRCQHANAEELAEVLSGLSGEGGAVGGGANTGTSVFSDANRNTNSRERGGQFSRTQNRLSSQSRTPGRSRSEAAAGAGGVTSVSFGENVSITADPSTNSLIIYSGKTEYEKLLELLGQLDIKRKQVLVEAMLLEVTLNESNLMGIEFLSSGGGQDGGVLAQSSFAGNLAQLIADPTQLSNFTLAAASAGTLTLPGDITIPTQAVLLNAAANNSFVNVLSAPNILATDNEQAEIVVGQNVPFVASTSTSGDNLNNTFNTVDRQDVGITLRITPQISSSNTVRLNIFTEVSDVVQGTANSDLGPTTTIRTSETVAITKNNQMVVIGGLMADNITEADTGVPYLMDIPVLGHLFKANTDSIQRTNLLIFITPRIISDQFDARDSTIEQRERAADRIIGSNIVPDREDLLFNEKIDDVVEVTPFEGEAPSTIRPSAPAFEIPAEAGTLEPSSSEEAVLELRVKPQMLPAERAGLSRSITTSSSGSQLVVVELEKQQEQGVVSVPFRISSTRRAYLEIPPGSSKKAKSFFQVGNLYSFGSPENHVTFRVVGSFPDKSEALQTFPEESVNWYTLAPFEILSLGNGPWVAEE